MGCLHACYSTSDDSTALAVIHVYEEALARITPPGFDDVLGEPFLQDSNADGIGDRVRPATVYEIKCKATWTAQRRQNHTQVGNNPESTLTLRLYPHDLEDMGLLVAGVLKLGPNDLLVRVKKHDGTVTDDFTLNPLICREAKAGPTGAGFYEAHFESRKTEL